MSSNEFRQKIGMKPASNPKADELRNSNISQPKEDSKNSESIDQSVDETIKEE